MSKEELLKTVWGLACARLGHPVCNAYFYREEGVPFSVTDEAITAECEAILAESSILGLSPSNRPSTQS